MTMVMMMRRTRRVRFDHTPCADACDLFANIASDATADAKPAKAAKGKAKAAPKTAKASPPAAVAGGVFDGTDHAASSLCCRYHISMLMPDRGWLQAL